MSGGADFVKGELTAAEEPLICPAKALRFFTGGFDRQKGQVMDINSTAFLMIDIQNDFCPGGTLAVADGDGIVPLVNRLQERFSVRVLTQDWHPADHSSFASNHEQAEAYSLSQMAYGDQVLWPDHCIQGTLGADFHPDLNTDKVDAVVRKGYRPEIDSYSGFFENDRKTKTGLAGYLRDREIKHLVLAGLATDFCVHYTAVDGANLGFQVTLLDDACRAIDLHGSLRAALQAMATCGVVVSTSSEIFA